MWCAAGEFDAFLARAARGRNELELARRGETDKRQNRFRTLVQVSAKLHQCCPRQDMALHAQLMYDVRTSTIRLVANAQPAFM